MFKSIEMDCISILEDCETIIIELEKYGLAISKSSRFFKFYTDLKKTYETKDSKVKMKIVESKEFVEGFRDYFEFSRILKSKNILLNAENELGHSLGGNRLSEDDRQNCARDYQYQLFIGAFYEDMGFKVWHEEPDLIIEHNDFLYGVAVKRVSSLSRISKRIREAEKQIIGSNHKGIIVISLDQIINHFEPFISGSSSKEIYEVAENRLEEFLKKHSNKLWFSRNQSIIGIVFTLIMPLKVANQNTFGSVFTTIYVPIDSKDGENEELFNQLINRTLKQ